MNHKLTRLSSIDPVDYMKYLEEYVFKTYDPGIEEFLAEKYKEHFRALVRLNGCFAVEIFLVLRDTCLVRIYMH